MSTSQIPILVTGGTGTLGRKLVPLLSAAGQRVRVLSRGEGEQRDGVTRVVGDLATGAGVDAAVAGTEIVVHCAGSARGDEVKAANLAAAAARAGTRHLVYISVVGADRIPVASAVDRAMFGYFAAKLEAERIVADSGIPWTTLRATQFHELSLETVRALAKLPLVPVPSGFRVQSVDSGEVAARLAELALGPPAGLVPDIGGPQALALRAMVRDYLGASGKHRLTVPMRPPGKAARAYREGANLNLERAVGRRTWQQFLADQRF